VHTLELEPPPAIEIQPPPLPILPIDRPPTETVVTTLINGNRRSAFQPIRDIKPHERIEQPQGREAKVHQLAVQFSELFR
jgi:hypothetical protein